MLSASGGVDISFGSPTTPGRFQLSGQPNQSYTLAFSGGSLENAAGDSIGIANLVADAQGTVPPGGTELIRVGATLTVGAGQPAGVYSTNIGGGVPFTITVNYD